MTIAAATRQPFNLYGWRVLDRWAYNSPEALQALERQGEVILLGRLLEQQEREQQVLMTDAALQALGKGAMPFEVLQAQEIQTELYSD